jgi:hypothetical protein
MQQDFTFMAILLSDAWTTDNLFADEIGLKVAQNKEHFLLGS